MHHLISWQLLVSDRRGRIIIKNVMILHVVWLIDIRRNWRWKIDRKPPLIVFETLERTLPDILKVLNLRPRIAYQLTDNFISVLHLLWRGTSEICSNIGWKCDVNLFHHAALGQEGSSQTEWCDRLLEKHFSIIQQLSVLFKMDYI